MKRASIRCGPTVILSVLACAASPPGGGAGATDQPTAPTVITWMPAFDTAEVGFLSSVWGSGPDDVYIVGGQPERGQAFHYDGADWSAMELPAVPVLIWVFGLGPDAVFAVGEQGNEIVRRWLLCTLAP